MLDRDRPADRQRQAQVVAGELREIGLNVDLQAMDWGTLITRRASQRARREERLEHLLHLVRRSRHGNPALNFPLRANGEKAWFGWPTDDKIEALRAQWMAAPDLAAQQKIAAEIQEEAFASVPFVPTGSSSFPRPSART